MGLVKLSFESGFNRRALIEYSRVTELETFGEMMERVDGEEDVKGIEKM